MNFEHKFNRYLELKLLESKQKLNTEILKNELNSLFRELYPIYLIAKPKTGTNSNITFEQWILKEKSQHDEINNLLLEADKLLDNDISKSKKSNTWTIIFWIVTVLCILQYLFIALPRLSQTENVGLAYYIGSLIPNALIILLFWYIKNKKK